MAEEDSNFLYMDNVYMSVVIMIKTVAPMLVYLVFACLKSNSIDLDPIYLYLINAKFVSDFWGKSDF